MIVTLEDARKLLAGVVVKNPGYIYRNDHTSCEYAERNGQPSCIIAHCVEPLGIAATDIPEGSVRDGTMWSSDWETYLSLVLDEDAMEYWQAAQDWQDNTTATWAQVLYAVDQGWFSHEMAFIMDPDEDWAEACEWVKANNIRAF